LLGSVRVKSDMIFRHNLILIVHDDGNI
jgi:hypothetical protein